MQKSDKHNLIKMIDSKEIKERVQSLGNSITKYYSGKDILVLGALKGSLYFMADLTRHIKNNITLEFVSIKSYLGKVQSSNIKLDDINFEVRDKNILIVEDIVDTGNSIHHLLEKLKKLKPREIKIVSFLFKPSVYKFTTEIDWVGYEIDNYFVVGYGMDLDNVYRNKKSIHRIE